jgi:spore germination protein YaaH
MDNYDEYLNDELRRKKYRRFRLFFLLFIILAIAVYVAVWFVRHDPSNNEEIGFWEYYTSLDRGAVGFIFEGERITSGAQPVFVDAEIYLPFCLVEEYIDSRIFWDGDSRVSVTNRTQAFRVDVGQTVYTLNGREAEFDLPILMLNGQPHFPASFLLAQYDVEIEFMEYINTVVVNDNTVDRFYANALLDEVPLRFEPNRRSPVQKRLSSEEVLTVFRSDGGFTYVMTSDGLSGYVAAGSITMHEPRFAPTPAPILFDSGITMVWDLVVNTTSVRNEARRYVPRGLGVISPSFFEFCFERLDGTLISIADQGYMDWAHANGLQVWPMVADFSHTVVTPRGVVSQNVLANTYNRERAIDELVMYTEQYGFDGINIDFEHIRRDDGVYYVQFIRELAPLLRERGVVLSVCKYVPMAHTAHYNRAETALAADYIVIMAYDEHYATSRVAGPNASINWVRGGIERTMNEVPAEQIILGIPFYVRVWRETETAEGVVVSQNAMYMDGAYNLFINNNATFEWCEITMSYYAEYRGVDDRGQTYTRRVWLEDERSMAAKLELVEEYGLAGVSGWRKGQEKTAIWDVIYSNLK